jgi:hypothetical protein
MIDEFFVHVSLRTGVKGNPLGLDFDDFMVYLAKNIHTTIYKCTPYPIHIFSLGGLIHQLNRILREGLIDKTPHKKIPKHLDRILGGGDCFW